VLNLKVSIIGASGRVGGATAFCLAGENPINELVLVSRKRSIDKIEGEALDMYDALAAKDVDVTINTSSNFESIADSEIVILSAGIPRKSGLNRIKMATANAKIVADYSRKIAEFSPDSVILVITNPVDVMTYVALKKSGFDRRRVIGLGNHLDSLRFKNYMAKHFNVHISEISTRIIGEHGEHMVPLISSTSIGGIPLEYYSSLKQFAGAEPFDIQGTIQKVIKVGNNITSKKKATEYGPAHAISNIVTTILLDERNILTVTAYLDGEIEGINDVCLGVPVILGEKGIKGIIPIKMSDDEREKFINASKIVKKSTKTIMKSLD
jgi:malate dehydrogenase